MYSSKQIAKILWEEVKRGEDPKRLADHLADNLLSSSQAAQLKQILFYLQEYAKRDKEENTFKVESPSELSAEQIRDIHHTLGEVGEVETSLNPELLAGFRIRYQDLEYDATLSTRLKKLKEALI